jgi:hypothetical protein
MRVEQLVDAFGAFWSSDHELAPSMSWGVRPLRVQARPFGGAQTAEWSQVALTAASIAFAFLEPDPTIEWDDGRLAEVRRALGSLGAVRAEDVSPQSVSQAVRS